MNKIQDQIADKMTKQALCSKCKHHNVCDKSPINNAWRFEYALCPKFEEWNNGGSTD